MDFIQLVSTIASIISIPLAIYYAHKTANATSDKARLEIIKTLSYKLSLERTLDINDIVSVYNSKLREHKIRNAKFDIQDIIHDLKSDIMSNAFIENAIRSEMLLNLSNIDIEKLSSPEDVLILKSPLVNRLYNLFVSPLPGVIFVLLITINVALLAINIFDIIYFIDSAIYIFNNEIQETEYLIYKLESFYSKTYLFISFPCLIVWGIIMLIRKKVKKNMKKRFLF